MRLSTIALNRCLQTEKDENGGRNRDGILEQRQGQDGRGINMYYMVMVAILVSRWQKYCTRLFAMLAAKLPFIEREIPSLLYLFSLLSDKSDWIWFSTSIAAIYLVILDALRAGSVEQEKSPGSFVFQPKYINFKFAREQINARHRTIHRINTHRLGCIAHHGECDRLW